MTKLNLHKFSPKKKNSENEKICYNCAFCGKFVAIDAFYRKACETICNKKIFCPFCLRNGFNTKGNRDVLILTFRGIIGYMYYAHYCSTEGDLTLSELVDCINAHEKTGLQNPTFHYDPETFLWFINFSKVGIGRKKVNLDNVTKTVENISNSFNIARIDLPVDEILPRFHKAIKKFYEQRSRPNKQRILCPTFSGITNDSELPEGCRMEMTRNFLPSQLVLRS